MFAQTPEPPYYAVIFTSIRTPGDKGYAETARRMEELAAGRPGFLGIESARDAIGISVSYWDSLEAIQGWKTDSEHALARTRGREAWYEAFQVRICRVERAYGWDQSKRMP